MSDSEFLQQAIALARRSVEEGGGPFGAVVVRDGKVLGRGNNRVTVDNDPTAHAEVVAIRSACQEINDFALHGATLYASCEPCPMCLAAAYWARVDRIVYAATAEAAAAAGFDDKVIAEQLCLPIERRTLAMEYLPLATIREVFTLWEQKEDKTRY